MEKKKDIVDKAVDALKSEQVPGGPPKEVVDGLVAKLAEASGVPPPGTIRRKIEAIGFPKLAAAAVLLVVASYAVGRLTAPRDPDLQQLQYALEGSLKSSLEPAIRQNLLEELKKYWQLALAGSYVQLKDDLGLQFRSEMNEFGVQILTASGTVTNRRLTELIEAIDAAQTQERRWIAAALEQIELNRLQDSGELRNDLATFAVQTGGELLRTKQDVARWIAYSRPDRIIPEKSKNSTPSEQKD
jgi:hypothetical protein